MIQAPNGITPYLPPMPQPSYNAVKIDIINPTAGGGQCAPQAGQASMAMGNVQGPQYAPITAPYYNYPEGPQLYQYPQAANQQAFYQPQVSQQAPVYVPQQQMPAAPQMTCPPCPACTPVEPQQVPVVPAPVVTQTNINAPTTSPIESVAAIAPAAVAPAIVPPTQMTPAVDVNAFLAKLTNSDYEIQANAMEEIANMVKDEPQKAAELLDEKIIGQLANIVKADTSKLAGPTQEQISARQKLMSNQQMTDAEKALANTITPMEQAERNKSYAMFTTSIMQKLYAEEVTKLTNTTVPLTELPGAVTVVEQLKDNPNPMVRASAIEAMSYIQQPAYKQDLNTLFTVAQKDQDKMVQEAATAALDKLSKI